MKQIGNFCFAIAIIALLSGCASLNEMMGMPANKGNGYSIKHDKQIYGGSVHIEYRDRAILEGEVRERMANRMATEEKTQAAISRIPSGGRVFITYEKTTIEAANTKWLEYIVLKDGQEVYRRKGSDKIANTPTSYSGGIGFWWNIDSLGIPVEVDNGFTIIVVSNIDNKRDTFVVSPPQA